ncbi:hypothetical protein [Thermodesulfatator indicus]|uniref:hypothetical protein n=1 Tax=Thermodesulfatator indicus TaxID=171695 RepID=UPI00059ED53B|nr:hypothetical protein [Thermodesulfatator indicus]
MVFKIQFLLVYLLLLAGFSNSWAQDDKNFSQKQPYFLIYASVSGFTWEEYEQGDKLLQESGPLYGLGLQLSKPLSRDFRAHTKVELFGGQVDYDGQTWGGDPVQTKVTYFGYKFEGNLGLPFWLTPRVTVEPFFRCGYKTMAKGYR